MKVEENQVYLRYCNVLFEYFKQAGCSEGQGGFLMRTMCARYSSVDQRDLLKYLYAVLFNLCQNGFLVPNDGPAELDGWINLSESGADYLQGGPMIVNKVDFNQYVKLEDVDDKQFDDLWLLIGKQNEAPFYISGPIYINMIRPYVSDYIPEYNTYIEERKQKEKATSRRVWYKELYFQIKPEKRKEFLSDLSYAVSLSYFYAEQTDDEFYDLFAEQTKEVESDLITAIPVLPDLQIEASNRRQTPEELLSITLEICNKFKGLVEDNRIYRLLYNNDKTPKDETAAQLLFYSVAKGYCCMHDIDINRESNPGIGELDFKFSVGNKSKVVIEMKLSTSNRLSHGFEKQLPAYLRAEEARYGILLVICLNKEIESELFKTQAIYQRIKDNPENNLSLICVDATPKPSASQI